MTGVFRFARVNVSLIRLHTNICKNGNLKKYINQINGFENNEKFSKALAKNFWCHKKKRSKLFLLVKFLFLEKCCLSEIIYSAFSNEFKLR